MQLLWLCMYHYEDYVTVIVHVQGIAKDKCNNKAIIWVQCAGCMDNEIKFQFESVTAAWSLLQILSRVTTL